MLIIFDHFLFFPSKKEDPVLLLGVINFTIIRNKLSFYFFFLLIYYYYLLLLLLILFLLFYCSAIYFPVRIDFSVDSILAQILVSPVSIPSSVSTI